MVADHRSFMFLHTLMWVSACKSDIICITQITLREIHKATSRWNSRQNTPSKIRDQQTNYPMASNLVILAKRLIPKCILSLQATGSKMSLKPGNLNLQLSTSKKLYYISLNVICVMQIMSALQADNPTPTSTCGGT